MRFFFITIILSAFALTANGQKQKKLVERTVHKDKIEAAISFIASDELRGRDTPSPELDITAKYLAAYLYGEGVQHVPGSDTYFQEVSMKIPTSPNEAVIYVGDEEFSIQEEMLCLYGDADNITAPFVFVEFGSENDYDNVDVSGKIVVMNAGVPENQSFVTSVYAASEKGIRAYQNGALAVLELYNSSSPNWRSVRKIFSMQNQRVQLDYRNDEEKLIPHLWIDNTGGKVEKLFQEYKGDLKLVLERENDRLFTTQNVIGFVEGTDAKLKDEIIIFSAHYDHVGVGEADMHGDSIYNGTRDNAVGTVTVMEAARNIAQYPLKRSAMFIFFTGEEKGLLGSEWFVEHPVVPLSDVVYCFNSDNAGYNDTTAATIIGLERTTAGMYIKEACKTFGLRTTDDPAPEQNLFDRSDQVSFARKGIPALMYSMGMKDFGEEILKYYHRQADNPDSIDYQYLYKFTKAYVLACRLVGNMKEKPFWIDGDKYYDAGVELYGR